MWRWGRRCKLGRLGNLGGPHSTSPLSHITWNHGKASILHLNIAKLYSKGGVNQEMFNMYLEGPSSKSTIAIPLWTFAYYKDLYLRFVKGCFSFLGSLEVENPFQVLVFYYNFHSYLVFLFSIQTVLMVLIVFNKNPMQKASWSLSPWFRVLRGWSDLMVDSITTALTNQTIAPRKQTASQYLSTVFYHTEQNISSPCLTTP